MIPTTYCKLYSTIVVSTLWSESKDVKLLFVTMLALKDSYGIVHATSVGLAKLAGLTVDETRVALEVLKSPDKLTERPQEFEGRRIEEVDGGWRVLNHNKYRDKKSPERAKYQAEWQKDYRKRKKAWSSKSSGTTAEREWVKRDMEGEQS